MADMYTVLFDNIILGRYEAGLKLKEDELAAEFGISRTPVREVLRQLAQDGLVEIHPKKTAKVIGFTADDVEEIYEIRKALEIQALRNSFAYLHIQGLKEIRDRIVQCAEKNDFVGLMEADEQTHNYFILASGRRRLITILEQMNRLIHHFRKLGYKNKEICEKSVSFHLALIDALCVRDINKAESLLENHIEGGKKTAVSKIINGF